MDERTNRGSEAGSDAGSEAGSEEPRRIDKGTPSFADTNIAEDQRHQARDRGAGLGAGGSDNRDARYGTGDADREVPEDDLD